MIVGTLNSWNIIALPPTPGFSDISITRMNTVGSYTSSFTQQTSYQTWPGADRISVHCSLPPMQRHDAAPWDAWMAECQGPLNCFLLPLPFDGKRLPGGATNPGLPVVSGTNNPGVNTLSTSGWTASEQRCMLPGDWFSIGYRIHTVISQSVTADGSGGATVNIWPSIRETPAAGTPLVLRNPSGLFRMAKNSQQVHIDVNGMWTVEFDAVEAR